MIQQTSIYLTSIILGIMLFFSFVVAPVTFTTLDEENASVIQDILINTSIIEKSVFFLQYHQTFLI